MESLIVAATVGFVLLSLLAIVLHLRNEQRFRDGWESVAAKQEMSFLPEAGAGLSKRFPTFKSFSVGYSRASKRLLESAGKDVLLGDYEYRIKYRHSLVDLALSLLFSNHYRHREFSICVLRVPGLSLTRCFVCREGLVEWFDHPFGVQDFDFPDDPEFSKAFVLQGDDEADVRARFDRRTREWLLSHRRRILRVEAHRDTLALFAPRLLPSELPALLAETRDLLSLWR